MYPEIKEIIIRRFGSLAAFAKKIGYSKSAVSQWLNGQKIPNINVLQLFKNETEGEVYFEMWSRRNHAKRLVN